MERIAEASCLPSPDVSFLEESAAMIRLDAERPVHFCDGLSRRDFLHAGSLTLLGLSLPQLFALKAQGALSANNPEKGRDKNCIFLFLVGGPSQLDTFDPKPNAPKEVRGPYKA